MTDSVIGRLLCTECKSWVWNSKTHECFLKNNYHERRNNIKCDACVACSKAGKYLLVLKGASSSETAAGASSSETVSTFTQQKDLSWAQELGIWMPKDIAKRTCTISKGYDQPAAYSIHSKPLEVQFCFECCNECAKVDGKLRCEPKVVPSLTGVRLLRRVQVVGFQNEMEGVLSQEQIRCRRKDAL